MPEHSHSTARIQAVSLFDHLVPCTRLRVSIQCLLLLWGILSKERLKVLGPHEAVARGGINQFLETIALDKILHHRRPARRRNHHATCLVHGMYPGLSGSIAANPGTIVARWETHVDNTLNCRSDVDKERGGGFLQRYAVIDADQQSR